MLKVYMHDGTVHNIPLDERSAAGLAEQMAILFARGGRVLSMRLDDAHLTQPKEEEKPSEQRRKARSGNARKAADEG